jgi:glycyl-tRNA synthetase beta chain
MTSQDFLVEIGTEELPPKALPILAAAFSSSIAAALTEHQLNYGTIREYASPRRLAVQVDELQLQALDKQVEVWGPPEKIAFDSDGLPTKAGLAFAKKNGLNTAQLTLGDSPKGKRLVHRKKIKGALAADILPNIVNTALDNLPIPKRMHWGNQKELFVRPVHWVVLLLGDQVLPAEILGIRSGATTQGHRFHHPEPLTLKAPADYADLLSEQGKVIANFNRRRDIIRQQVIAQAEALGFVAVLEDELLDEVTALVEWPVALTGQFEERFLQVPQEALISSMTEHQKYFPVIDSTEQLQPYFIFVSNLESTNPSEIIEGNQKVIRPRLADAAFFYETDQQHSLESRLEQLDNIVFQDKLGSLRDKSTRVAKLARFIAHQIGADSQATERAALLAKCDLVSEMVLEFSDLQGIAGYYYALNDGEPKAIAEAIKEQYLPRFAGDDLPITNIGGALALADRLDTLVGIFGINQPPSGSKDPFALRRAALGIIRIIRERQFHQLDLNDLIFEAKAGYGDLLSNPQVEQHVSQFIFDRYRAIYYEEGIATDTVIAVQNALQDSPTTGHNPYDVALRIQAVEAFRALPESSALAAANKRVQNIIAKQDKVTAIEPVVLSLLRSEHEANLHRRLIELAASVPQLCEQRDYGSALKLLATLKIPIDDFFDSVMVMDDDPALRNNRINLLRELHHLFIRIADIAQLQERVSS